LSPRRRRFGHVDDPGLIGAYGVPKFSNHDLVFSQLLCELPERRGGRSQL
jgi:hypothetical protein